MINDNFRKRRSQGGRQRYLRYDDVFMSNGSQRKKNIPPQRDGNWDDDRGGMQIEEPEEYTEDYSYGKSPNFEQNYVDDNQYDDSPVYDQPNNRQQDLNYFSGRNNIVNERMMRYQKRQLPPLQRYSPNSHRDAYAEFNQSYWDEDREQPTRRKFLVLGPIWQKFIITFASLLSLVCLSWIAYNWNSNKPTQMQYGADGIPIIEPNQSVFKVLPESPGGAEIAYRDKTVYSKIDNGMSSLTTEEKLLPPQEEAFPLPERQSYTANGYDQDDVEEYSIVSDKIYYIKLSAGKDRQILINESKLLKKRYETLLGNKGVAVKKVSNSRGELQRAILVGPFSSQEAAINTAKEIGEKCSVISVRE